MASLPHEYLPSLFPALRLQSHAFALMTILMSRENLTLAGAKQEDGDAAGIQNRPWILVFVGRDEETHKVLCPQQS